MDGAGNMVALATANSYSNGAVLRSTPAAAHRNLIIT